MVLLIGLMLALVFSLTCDKFIKKHANILYIVCAVISAAVAFINTKGLPSFVNTYIIELFSRSTFATSLWIVVMWTGALKNGSKLIKKLMPIRSELSIMAAILTLSHNVSFGKIYFVRFFVSPYSMSATHLAAAIMSLTMLLIMIPLTIISFPKVRKKINRKLWKKIQRAAYSFYALIYFHVMTLYLPMAKNDNICYWVGILIYSIIFISYAVCRIKKCYILRRKPENTKVINLISAVVIVVLIVVISILAFSLDNITVTTNNNTQSSDSKNVVVSTETDTEFTTEKATENKTEEFAKKTTEETTENSTEESTENTTEENNIIQSEKQVVIYEQTNSDVQSTDNQYIQIQDNTLQNTQQSYQTASQNNTQQSQQIQQVQQPTTEKIYIYNNGTYTATAFGYDGDVEVSVTIKNDVITNITGRTFESDSWYFNSAKGSIFSQIIDTQQTNVDAYSGATYSSNAIITAVKTALNSAKNN